MQSIAQELNYKTLAYWELSQVWNGRVSREVATGEAIEICSNVILSTSCVRPLSYRFEALQMEIVQGEGNKPNPHSKVLEFPLKEKKKQQSGATA